MDIIDKFIDDVNISLYGKLYYTDENSKQVISHIYKDEDDFEDIILNTNISTLCDLLYIGGEASNPENYREYSKKIALLLYKFQRIEEARKYLKEKNVFYFKELLKIFESIYDKLTIEEEAYILDHINNYNLYKYYPIPFVQDYHIMLHQEHILHYRIHDKTGKKYFKILKKLKETYLAYYIYRYDELDDVNIAYEINEIKYQIKSKK